MRPYHEMARIVGLTVPEPRRADPRKLVTLGLARMITGATLGQAIDTIEFLAREEDIKPAVLMAAVRELAVLREGQQQAWITGTRSTVALPSWT